MATISNWIILDIIIGLILLARISVGLRQGLIVSVLSLVGTIIGAILGIVAFPYLIAIFPMLVDHRLLGTVALIIFDVIVMSLMSMIFREIARQITGKRRARGWDALAGAVASLLVASMIMWTVLSAIRPITPADWGRSIDESRIYNTIDRLLPEPVRSWPTRTLDAVIHYIPDPFSGFTPEMPISPPNQHVDISPMLKDAEKSVVKVMASTPACSSDMAGSGWVVGKERVLTNAHVVAGSTDVSIKQAQKYTRYQALVIAFDPQLDLALLDVPGLDAPPLERAEGSSAGDDVYAAGYPWGGRYELTPLRMRGMVNALSADIYGQGQVQREIYAVRGQINPGNSGGPLLNKDGKVVGTVFAKAGQGQDTGYVLTNNQTAPLADHLDDFTTVVATGGCVSR